jgi:hypothetical protein
LTDHLIGSVDASRPNTLALTANVCNFMKEGRKNALFVALDRQRKRGGNKAA